MYINKSLTFLEQTVIALADRKKNFVPFRQTKLTHCLKDSIGGNCNSLLIANIWGEAQQIEETVRIPEIIFTSKFLLCHYFMIYYTVPVVRTIFLKIFWNALEFEKNLKKCFLCITWIAMSWSRSILK